MFNVDPKLLARIAPDLARVLVFDPQPAAVKLVSELLKEMGARHIVSAPNTLRGMETLAQFDPQLICTEMTGPDFDGVTLTTRLRRSTLPGRKAPVIVISGDATVERIKSARDAGAHEFLRKPYTAKDLLRRVENVLAKPRDWIEAKAYVGPDRRRFNSGEFLGARRRQVDQGPVAITRITAAGCGPTG